MMPKTAINFYNLQKGLYLKNSEAVQHMASALSSKPSQSHVIGTDEQAVTKSLNILSAYGELASNQNQIVSGEATASENTLSKFHKINNTADNAGKSGAVMAPLAKEAL